MNNKTFIPVWVLASGLLFISACKKIDVDDITATDNQGQLIGAIDNSDWALDGKWSKKETALFNFENDLDLTGTAAGTIEMYPAFPNACYDEITLQGKAESYCIIKFVMVDRKMQIIGKWSTRTRSDNRIVARYIFPPIEAGYYRLYYAFYAEGKPMFYKGHGDIKKL